MNISKQCYRLYRFITLILLGTTCCADGVPKILSKSHDGQYEVRRFQNDPSLMGGLRSFGIAVFEARTGRRIYTLHSNYDYAHYSDTWELISLWHPTLPVVAIDVPEGRRSGHIEIFSVKHRKVLPLTVPDYLMNALGRVKAVETGNTAFSHLQAWNGNHLTIELSFNAQDEKTHEFQGYYESTVTLRIDDTGFIQLISMTDTEDK